MPLDSTTAQEPERRDDVLAQIHRLALTCATTASEGLATLSAVPPAALNSEVVHAYLLTSLQGLEQAFRLAASICGIIDLVRQGKPLPPADHGDTPS